MRSSLGTPARRDGAGELASRTSGSGSVRLRTLVDYLLGHWSASLLRRKASIWFGAEGRLLLGVAYSPDPSPSSPRDGEFFHFEVMQTGADVLG